MGILEMMTAVLLANCLTIFALTFVNIINYKLAVRKARNPIHTEKVKAE